MNRSYVLCLVGLVVAMGGCAPRTTVRERQTISVKETKRVTSRYTGPKRRVGIVAFENKTTYGQRLGSAATDVLITELAKTGKFILVEREKLQKILEEQQLQQSGAIDPNTIVKVGRLLGLNAIITGSVTQYGTKTEGADYLLVRNKRYIAEAGVDIRVVDAETGEILYADSGKGIAKKATGQVIGLGTSGGFDETMEGEAFRAAIVQFVDNIVSQVNRKPWSCRVAEVSGDQVYLDAGQESGLELGTKLVVYRTGKTIVSPTTGLVVGQTEEELGTLEVERYFGENGTVARVLKGETPGRNDLCRLKA
ncbi:MAG: hypothetical protein HYZ73_08710 [Elusimicrobia bacterium]|nr:hypothetical protein [Elusimicrobiota bacterium]